MRIVIGDGLTRECLSPEMQYNGHPSNVGAREIERLLGRGKTFGQGPLVRLIASAVEAGSGSNVGVVFLGTPTDGAEDIEWVDPLQKLAANVTVVPSSADTLPAADLVSAFAALSGASPEAVVAGEADLGFLVVGCHTDQRILALATYLRTVLGYPDVAVSPHLVASATPDAHFAALRHNLPKAGIDVLLDLEEASSFLGLDEAVASTFDAHPCIIEPPEARDQLDPSARRIVELLCMHWSRANLRPLAGGFSGSLLFIADGWKGEAQTEPMVLKIDEFPQMRRELDGYHQVKDFFGKHVPTFGYPVTHGEHLGVGMELAAMEGRPSTLQDTFEEAEDEAALAVFFIRLDKALELLGRKLYANTRETSWVAPYRVFGLHAERQLDWLKDNADLIVGYAEEAGGVAEQVDVDYVVSITRLVTRNEDGLESETCLQHGDLNLANVICDEGDNVWFIDWTHSGPAPIELDFAKVESDAKFVMSKAFDHDDLLRLKRFEEYLLSHRIPPDIDGLPDSLKFVKWDLRYRKILGTVRRVRQACFSLKESDDWVAYRVALLRYATHTLSFDERRDRGECDATQLMYALYSVEALAMDLVVDDFHMKIRAERAPEYPPRQRISIDEAIWILDCPDYDPPYFVTPEVLEADNTKTEGGWADPEDWTLLGDQLQERESRFRDDDGRPLNPRGRTGIAGRGLLGLWGANLAVAPVVVRRSSLTGGLEVLLGSEDDGVNPEIPKGFLLPGEAPDAGLGRVLETDMSWSPTTSWEVVNEGYTYDPRQTDHAWVETRASLAFLDDETAPDLFEAGGAFSEAGWWPLDADTANRLPSGHAGLLREAVAQLQASEKMDAEAADLFLARTG